MSRVALLLAIVVGVLVIYSSGAPQFDFDTRSTGKKSIDTPAKIAFFEQEQSPDKSQFRYNDTNGNSRWETVNYQAVKSGDKEAVVPEAEGGFEYTHDGVNIRQTYTSGAKGTIYSTKWNAPKKGQ